MSHAAARPEQRRTIGRAIALRDAHPTSSARPAIRALQGRRRRSRDARAGSKAGLAATITACRGEPRHAAGSRLLQQSDVVATDRRFSGKPAVSPAASPAAPFTRLERSRGAAPRPLPSAAKQRSARERVGNESKRPWTAGRDHGLQSLPGRTSSVGAARLRRTRRGQTRPIERKDTAGFDPLVDDFVRDRPCTSDRRVLAS